MSLMRLLSSGRSWVGLKETSRYVMTDPRAMPKFGSGKNPFCNGTPKMESAGTAAAPMTNRESQSIATEPREAFGVRRIPALSVRPTETAVALPKAQRRDTAHSKRFATQGEARSRRGLRASWADAAEQAAKFTSRFLSSALHLAKSLRLGTAAFFRKLGSLIPRRRSRPRTAAIASFAKGPLQGELSLDRIKVVRNDLSDVDLEVVRRSESVPTTASLMPVAPERSIQEAEQAAWAPVTPGLIGAGKT